MYGKNGFEICNIKALATVSNGMINGQKVVVKRVTIAAGKTTIVDVKLASNRARLTGKGDRRVDR